jgi:hypothetical protein
MENLCMLTDPFKTPFKTASHIAKCVIIGDEQYNVREEVQLLMQRCVEAPVYQEESGEGGGVHTEQIHHLMLLLFSNSLTLTAQAGVLEGAVKSQVWFTEFLIPTLLKEIQNAKLSPNNARVAATCINSLVTSSMMALDRVMGLDGLHFLRSAHEVGRARHELLAIETKQCISSLESSL